MKRFSRLLIVGGVLLAGWAAAPSEVDGQPKKGPAPEVEPQRKAVAEASATPEQLAFFEKNIRPVLVRECYSCHAATAEKIRGRLTLDTREGIRKGGDTGPAVVPGDVRNSLLLKAIKHTDKELKMPPKKKLGDEVVATFEKWIAIGAPDPRDGSVKVAKKYEIDIEKGRQFWSFLPPKKAALPAVKDAAWPKSDIDRFLLAELEAKGLKPVAGADARTLLRRVYFDLVALPPAPEAVDAFAKDYSASPQTALAAVVDKLLASPQYGERWGRHWLDVARYAESSGRAVNFAYPHAWRCRDYVMRAFNADKPYDQFIREQLAGDLLPAKDDKETAEFLVATGFLAIGPKAHDERNRRQFLMDVADEQIDTTFQVFQGLTVACARCHDHKFDPIPQKDYYSLAGIFRSTETCYGTIRLLQSNHPSPLVNLPKSADVTIPLEPLTAERRAAIDKQIKDTRDEMAKVTGQNAFLRRIFMQGRVSTMQSQLALYESDGTPKALAMGVRESRFPADSALYIRGELSQPSGTVRRGFPQVLTQQQPTINGGSGRRQLADWIASRDNPLTARVMANRVWLHLIGRGLVPTPDNFGASGQPASHPALLDHLALNFADNGWSVKKLIRTIVLSRAYQLSSQFDDQNFEADPDNVLVWRMPKRRLEAEALRDTMLALAGELDLTPPKGSSVQRGGEGNASFRFRGGPGAGPAPTDKHRTVYLSIIRDGLPEALTLFDFPDPSLIVGERATTTVPAQALYMLNNAFVISRAEEMADRLLALEGDDTARLKRAYALCYSRPPSQTELEYAQQFLSEYGRNRTGREHGRRFVRRSSPARNSHNVSNVRIRLAAVQRTAQAQAVLRTAAKLRRSFHEPDPAAVSRRDALKSTVAGFGYLAFAGLSTMAAEQRNPLAPRRTHFPAKAKHVIFLCMEGAPSHVDTFDYKPKLAERNGQSMPRARTFARLMASPFRFAQHGQSGLWISDVFPEVARHADELCLLHGMHTDVPAHSQAFLQLHTGIFQFKRPSMGAWAFYGLGTENENLPGFVTINPPLQNGGPANYGSAFLPAVHQGTPIRTGFGGFGGGRGGPGGGSGVSNIRNPSQTSDAQRTQLDFIRTLNRETLHREPHNPGVEGAIESLELAFRMQNDLPRVLDISNESAATRALYGIGTQASENFGRQCLLARRFVEAGVRFVEVTSGQWDHHQNLRTALTNKAQSVDKPIAGLLQDLKARGLLDDTLVLWGGEFGRTPYGQGGDGRDHNHRGFTTWMAGGGVRGGFSYGATDEFGYEAVEGKMHIHDWHATILHLLGLHHERLTYRYAGRDMRLTDVRGTVVTDIIG